MADFRWALKKPINLIRLEIGQAEFGAGPDATAKENAKRAIVVSLCYGLIIKYNNRLLANLTILLGKRLITLLVKIFLQKINQLSNMFIT